MTAYIVREKGTEIFTGLFVAGNLPDLFWLKERTMNTTWWLYYPEDGFVRLPSREEANSVCLYGDDFLYDNEWHDAMPHVRVIRCDKPVPHFEYSGDKHDWLVENSIVTDTVKEIVIAEKPDDPTPPLSLLAPWRQQQLDDWLDDWWEENWQHSPDYDRIVNYEWQSLYESSKSSFIAPLSSTAS